LVVGDQDDVSGYRQGVRKAFEGAVNSERRLLVYENARHNVGDDTRRGYLDLPVKSAEGSTVWKGFQRRWALGLQMYRYAAGQAAR
jgi:hypothetical protein